MRVHRLVLSLLALVAAAGPLLAQEPATTALVRLSYVQGEVKILQGEATQFDQAQANMPLLAGYTLSTGQEGQAEVEFTDGSVARVTPNSQLRLDKLPAADERDQPTEVTMLSGLGYFELNTANGQHFVVHFNAAQAQPVTNSIFRINLDNAPEVSVFVGTVRASVSGAFDQTVEEGRSLHFAADDVSNVTTASIQGDTWDQWNQDRDNQIAQQAQQQTTARETSGATDEPGWDDLDANGDWYPVEGYG
ncbi:MAG TPA: FecR family protein, partial [Acidobacteriaceae bacterium]